MVPTTVCKQVPVCVPRQVAYTTHVRVPYQVTEMVAVKVCKKVPVQKCEEVQVKVCRKVPVCVPEQPCPPPCCHESTLHRVFGRLCCPSACE
jgi:hypothetical protein